MTSKEYKIRRSQSRKSLSLSIPAAVVLHSNRSSKPSNHHFPHPVPLRRFLPLWLLLHLRLQHLRLERERGRANVCYLDVPSPHPLSTSITFSFRSEAKLYDVPSRCCTSSAGSSTARASHFPCHSIHYCCSNCRSKCIRFDCANSRHPHAHWAYDSPPTERCGC